MAGSMNKVFLLGNLTRNPELRYTAQGSSVCNFSIAVNRSYKGGDGEYKKEVNFFKIVVWGKSADNCDNYLSKGGPVLVEGRLQNRSYETQDGQKRTTTEIVADQVTFLNGGGDKPEGCANGGEFAGETDDEAVPF